MTSPHPPLRFGILGCANIARGFARDAAASPAVRIAAVSSRDGAKAAAFAREFGIARSHASYEALLADGDVDAIYLPLPNSLHAEWAMRAAAAGKHVLCEKPLALSRAEALAMFDAARRHGVFLLESYPYWFQPQTAAMLGLIAEGTIGAVRSVQAAFGFTLADRRHNIRARPELGGGALLDAGCYPASLIRLVMGAAPASVRAQSQWLDTGVDLATYATLRFADGRFAQLMCSMDVGTMRHALVTGSAGTIDTEYLNNTAEPGVPHPHGYQPSRLRVRRGVGNTLPLETIASPAGSGFRFAAEAFARVVAERDSAAIERAAQASLDIAATLEALAKSAREDGREVAV